MYDEAQEKFKTMKEEERFIFKTTKSKKRKEKETNSSKIFDVLRHD